MNYGLLTPVQFGMRYRIFSSLFAPATSRIHKSLQHLFRDIIFPLYKSLNAVYSGVPRIAYRYFFLFSEAISSSQVYHFTVFTAKYVRQKTLKTYVSWKESTLSRWTIPFLTVTTTDLLQLTITPQTDRDSRSRNQWRCAQPPRPPPTPCPTSWRTEPTKAEHDLLKGKTRTLKLTLVCHTPLRKPCSSLEHIARLVH